MEVEPVDKTGSYVVIEDEELINSLKMGDVAKLDFGECDSGTGKFTLKEHASQISRLRLSG